MGSTTYKRQPVSRVGSSYQGDLVRTILREMDEELLRLASQVALTTEPDPNDELELSNYFFLPGRTGNTVGHGGVGASGYLQLWSSSLTGASDAGFIELRTDSNTANDLVRLGRGGGGSGASPYFRITRDGRSWFTSSTTAGVVTINSPAGGPSLVVGFGFGSQITFQAGIGSQSITGSSAAELTGPDWTLRGNFKSILRPAGVDALTETPFTIQRLLSQTGDLTKWVNEDATPVTLASITSAGHLQTSLVSLKGVTSGNYASLAAADTTATYTLKLPQTIAGATFGQLLVYDGSGGLTFASLDADLAAIAGITRDRGDLIVGGASAWVDLALGSAGKILRSDGTDLVYTTATYPATAGTSGNVLTSDGTNWTSAAPAGGTHDMLSATHTDTLAAGVSRGSLIVGNATPKWSELVIGPANTVLQSNSLDPAWAKVNLLTMVDGVSNFAIFFGDSGGITETPPNVTTTRKYLSQIGDGVDATGPTWEAIAAGAHDMLSASHTDTLAAAVSRGSLIVGNATPKWAEVTIGAANTFLGSDGTDTAWTAPGALTKTDDTNVTLTLGGAPTTALLRAASLTLGWAGTLSIARGGTGGGTATAAFNALSPLTTRGDLLTNDGTNDIRLAIGADGWAFHTDGVDASWVLNPGWLGDHTWIDCRPVIKGVAAGPLPIQWWNTASGANRSFYLGPVEVITALANVTVEVPNIPGQTTITGSGASEPPTASQVLGKVNRVGVVASIGSAGSPVNLTSGAPAGFYELQVYTTVTTTSTSGSKLEVFANWNDGAAVSNQSILTQLGTAGNTYTSTTKLIKLAASSNISYYAVRTTGGTYTVSIRLTFKGT